MDLTDRKYINTINKIRQPGGKTFGNVTDLLKKKEEAPNTIPFFKDDYIQQCSDFVRVPCLELRHQCEGTASYLIEQTELPSGVGIQDLDLRERQDKTRESNKTQGDKH